jgi:alkyl hydroperoxide reductase subunit F
MDLGGQTLLSLDVENYTGYHFIKGSELVKKFEDHLKDYKIKIRLREKVTNIKKKGKIFKITTTKSIYKTRTIIIASGKTPKKLNVPGEDKLYNKGLSYCATCDAPLFKNKIVAVLGGGNSALEATLGIMKIAKKIYLIDNSSKIHGEKILLDKINKSKKVTVLNKADTKEILGYKFVSGIKLIHNGKEKIINLNGVFVEIGLIPGCDFADIIKKNKWGEIMIKRTTMTMQENLTNISGIYAAGDVTDIPAKQIIVAAGEGAKAALAVFDYLGKQKDYWI